MPRPPKIGLTDYIVTFTTLRLHGNTLTEIEKHLGISQRTHQKYRGRIENAISATWGEDCEGLASAYILKNKLISDWYTAHPEAQLLHSKEKERISKIDREVSGILSRLSAYYPKKEDTALDRVQRDIAIKQLLEYQSREETHRRLMEGLDAHYFTDG